MILEKKNTQNKHVTYLLPVYFRRCEIALA